MYLIPFFENLQDELLFECLVGLVMKSPLPALRLRYSSDFPQYSVGQKFMPLSPEAYLPVYTNVLLAPPIIHLEKYYFYASENYRN